MSESHMSAARIGPGLDQARFWLEGFSDGEDGENVSEKDVPEREEPKMPPFRLWDVSGYLSSCSSRC